MNLPAESSRQSDVSVSFREWLVARQTGAKGRRKGERTRDRIRLATVDLLNESGYRELRVADVCDRAEITAPVLYRYFESKQALVEDVLREFLAQFSLQRSRQPATNVFESILDANLRWLQWSRANSGLIQCLLDFSSEIQEFADLFAKANNEWHLRTAHSIMRRFPPANTSIDEMHLTVIALGGMMDDITRRFFSMPDEHVSGLVAKVAPTDENLARFLTEIWCRAIYGSAWK